MTPEQLALRVKRVRDDDTLGRGSCSTYDECYTDEELAEHIQEFHPFKGPDALLTALRREERSYWEVLRDREAASRW